MNKIWEQLLPQELLDKAYHVSELGDSDYAWDDDGIEEVCSYLLKKDILILGGDVFINVNGILDWALDNWSYNGSSSEESVEKTMEYINKYIARNGKGYAFSLVIRNYRPHLKDNLDWEFNHEGKFVRRYIL